MLGVSQGKAKAKAKRAKRAAEREGVEEIDDEPTPADRLRVFVVAGLLLLLAAGLAFLAFHPSEALSAFDGAPWLELSLGALALGLALVPGWNLARRVVRVVLILAAFGSSRSRAS